MNNGHLLFDKQATSILKSIDLARRADAQTRRYDDPQRRRFISRRQTISDDDDSVPPQDMILRLLADNRHIVELQRAAIAVCDEHGDSPTSNILHDLLDQTERRVWFLFEIAQEDEGPA